MQISKYQALGNDYLVCDSSAFAAASLTRRAIQRICDRHFGVGSDGILVGSLTQTDQAFHLRILNPDGSEAEKSGNGLRIYAKYLWDLGIVQDEAFRVATLGGIVQCRVGASGGDIDVEMGQVSFLSTDIPMTGPPREVLREVIRVASASASASASDEDETVEISAATIGNPHCVVLRNRLDVQDVCRLGPLLEHAKDFPERTNVQFMRVLDRSTIQIEIWERGAGYTLASGSSSSAAAAVARRLGFVDNQVAVRMPGGELQITLDDSFRVRMVGPASKVADVVLADELLTDCGNPHAFED